MSFVLTRTLALMCLLGLVCLEAEVLGAPPSWLSDNEVAPPTSDLTLKTVAKTLYRLSSLHKATAKVGWSSQPPAKLSPPARNLTPPLVEQPSELHSLADVSTPARDLTPPLVEQHPELHPIPDVLTPARDLTPPLVEQPPELNPLPEVDKSQRFTHSIRTGWLVR